MNSGSESPLRPGSVRGNGPALLGPRQEVVGPGGEAVEQQAQHTHGDQQEVENVPGLKLRCSLSDSASQGGVFMASIRIQLPMLLAFSSSSFFLGGGEAFFCWGGGI